MAGYAEDLSRLRAQLNAEIAALEAFETRTHDLLLAHNPPPEAIALVKEAVQNPEVTRFNFRKWIASKLPNFFCGPSKAQIMDAFSLAFGALVAWNTLNMDQSDPNDFAMCDRNRTWPPDCWPHCPPPAPPPLNSATLVDPRHLNGMLQPMMATPNKSVVDEVFAKAKATNRMRERPRPPTN